MRVLPHRAEWFFASVSRHSEEVLSLFANSRGSLLFWKEEDNIFCITKFTNPTNWNSNFKSPASENSDQGLTGREHVGILWYNNEWPLLYFKLSVTEEFYVSFIILLIPKIKADVTPAGLQHFSFKTRSISVMKH